MKKHYGFTLIEVLIVVVILGILSAIVVPNYQNYVMRGHRSTVQARMLEIAGLLENNHLQRGQYEEVFITALNADSSLTKVPDIHTRYNIVTEAANNNQSYTITATPTTAQSKDKCGKLTLNNFEQKTAKKDGANVTGCW